MAIIIDNLKAYFKREFSPEKLKWDQIVEDEKKGRSCPHCRRFGFYIHLPTSLREYWWGMYRCKGCKTEYRPGFTKGNLFFLLLLAFLYFNYFGKTGFSYKSYLTMAVGFAFAIGVNYVYARMSRKAATTATLLGGLGWILAIADLVLAHHGEGVATGNPKDMLYLFGSTGGFTFAGGSLLGLIPGVQPSIEGSLRLFHERFFESLMTQREEQPLVDPDTGEPLTVHDGKYESGKPGQVWYNGQWIDRETAAQWIKEHQEEIAKRDEERKQFWDDVERNKEHVRIDRIKNLEREGWVYDPERDAYVPGPNHPDVIAERRRQEAERLNQFIEKHVDDLKRAEFLQDFVDRVRENGGDMDKLRNAIKDNTVGAEQQLSMGESESNLAEAKAWQESEKYAETVRDWSQRANRVIGKFVPGAGTVINIIQNSTYSTIKGYDEGGVRGALTSAAASTVDAAVSVYTGIPTGVGSAFRNAWGTEYTRDKDGNFISPFDRFTSKVWHNFADQYDPRVFWDRIENAKGLGDYFDISVDLLEARDDFQKFRDKLGEIRDRGIQIDMEMEPGSRPKGGADETAEAPSRQSKGAEDASGEPKPDRFRRVGEGGEDSPGTPPGGRPPKTPGGDEGGGPPKQPNIPSDLAEDYKNYQRAVANGDDAAANRYATRMLAKNYDEFKGMVKTGDIDPETGRRAVETHQQIVSDGVKEGIERTKRAGNLLQEEVHIDADGNITTKPVIKHTWSAGGGMEEFDPAKPKVPGDTDLTHVVDRDMARARGLDPDQVQEIAKGHTEDSINDLARKRLGDDIGDYSSKTKIKHTPGSDEEYLSYQSHKTDGTVMDSQGVKKTTLGEEMGRSREIDEAVGGSATGRAMQRADEHNLISHTINERKPTGDVYRDGETAREIVKHFDRMSEYNKANPDDPANWKPDNVDKSKIHSPEGFDKVLEAVRTENPAKIKEALDNDPQYKGDYDKFFQDVKESSKQGVQKSLDEGGKVWDAQTERLRADGVEIDKEHVVRHTSGPETKGDYLRRLGVTDGEQKGDIPPKKTGPDLSEYVPKKETFRTESAKKLYESIKDQEPPRDEKGNITGFGEKPEPEVTNTREAAFARESAQKGDEPTPEQIEARELDERVEAQKEKDPVFKDLNERVRRAKHDGQDLRIENLKEEHAERMMNEGKWGSPDDPGFRKELGKRLSIDQRIEDPTTVKLQEQSLVQEKVTREQWNAWLEVDGKLRRGEPVEPLKSFGPPDEKSWAPIKDGESAFRPDDEPSPGTVTPEKQGAEAIPGAFNEEILAGEPRGFNREEVLGKGSGTFVPSQELETGSGFSKKPPGFPE